MKRPWRDDAQRRVHRADLFVRAAAEANYARENFRADRINPDGARAISGEASRNAARRDAYYAAAAALGCASVSAAMQYALVPKVDATEAGGVEPNFRLRDYEEAYHQLSVELAEELDATFE